MRQVVGQAHVGHISPGIAQRGELPVQHSKHLGTVNSMPQHSTAQHIR
jgi:hypothetical protein